MLWNSNETILYIHFDRTVLVVSVKDYDRVKVHALVLL